MSSQRRVTSTPLFLLIAALISWSSHAGASEASSCVTCHLDEDMLTESLKIVKTKKSAMQSGAG